MCFLPILRPRLSEVELQELLPDEGEEGVVRWGGEGLTRPAVHLQPLQRGDHRQLQPLLCPLDHTKKHSVI